MIKKLVILPLLTALAVLFGATPSAQAAVNGAQVSVTVIAEYSMSNMLFSFQDTSTAQWSQAYVCEGCTYGEGGSYKVFSEPQNMWTNPGYCSGHYYIMTNKRTGAVSRSATVILSGGSNGFSFNVNPGGGLSSDYTYRIYAWLSGC